MVSQESHRHLTNRRNRHKLGVTKSGSHLAKSIFKPFSEIAGRKPKRMTVHEREKVKGRSGAAPSPISGLQKSSRARRSQSDKPYVEQPWVYPASRRSVPRCGRAPAFEQSNRPGGLVTRALRAPPGVHAGVRALRCR